MVNCKQGNVVASVTRGFIGLHEYRALVTWILEEFQHLVTDRRKPRKPASRWLV